MADVATRDDSRPDAVDTGAWIAMDESESAPRAVIDAVAGAALDPQRGDDPRRRREDDMSERATGATPEQVEAAAIRGSGHTPETWRGTSDAYQDQETTWWRGVTKHIVPPDHRILGPDDLAALWRVINDLGSDQELRVDRDRLAALIGDDGNG
jgi:hypothetical protein